MVPEGWKHTTFEKHIDLLSGFAFKSNMYTSSYDDIRLLRGDNIEPGALRWRNAKRWPASEYEGLHKYHLKVGDFIIAMDRTWITSGLKVAEVQQHDLPCLLVQRVSRIRAISTLEQGLLRQYFSSHKFEQYVKSVQTETAVPHISAKQIKEFPLLLPPLMEQKKIAKILSTWDKAIVTVEQLIANSQRQKKAIMQQLLTGKTRLPGFDGEWRECKLGSLFMERVETNRKDLPLLSITAGDGVMYQEDTGRKNTSNDDKSKYRRICVNDIGYNTMRMWQGRSSLSDKEGIVSPAYTIVTPGKKIEPEFAAYLFKLPELVHVFYRRSQGLVSDTWNLKFNQFKKIPWLFPEISEQKKIAQILVTTDREIVILQNQLAHMKQEKKALMQQLLTGKRRVTLEVA